MRLSKAERERCYLCAGRIHAVDRTVDHIPPKNLFPEVLRRKRNFDRLMTLPAHRACNESFAKDEEYFLHSLGLLARSSAGAHVAARLIKSVEAGQRLGLHRRVDAEFSRDDEGRLQKTSDYDRIYRVAHKIVRGLWAAAPGDHYLPPEWSCAFRLYDRDNPPPRDVQQALAEGVRWGAYPEIFDFVAERLPGDHAFFGMIFWEWLLITAVVRIPAAKSLPSRQEDYSSFGSLCESDSDVEGGCSGNGGNAPESGTYPFLK